MARPKWPTLVRLKQTVCIRFMAALAPSFLMPLRCSIQLPKATVKPTMSGLWAACCIRFIPQESPFNGPNLTFLQTQQRIKDFGQDPANRVFPNPQNKMEQLINAMMHPDPAQRPSLESVMQLSVFDGVRDGSGKAMVRQLLQ